VSKILQALQKAEKESKNNIISLPVVLKKCEDVPEVPEVPYKNFLDERLVSILDPKSAAAEQYKKIRTRILQFPDFAPKTILITSSTPQEGKSTTAANLAITIAQGFDEHVLLLDCDLRRPSLERFFGLDSWYGLTDYMMGDIDLPGIIRDTCVSKLKILSSGSPSYKPSEVISSRKMKDLIQELKSRYDDRYIIIDSSPVAASDEPDILAKQVDGIILVVRAGKTPREVIEATLKSLEGRNILGIVFNDLEFSLKRVKYSYYGYYGHVYKED